VLAAMVEEADVVVLALQRPDLAFDEGVELPQIRRDLGRNVEIHGATPPVNVHSPGILRSRQVDPEAAAAAFCRQADGVAAMTAGGVEHHPDAKAAAPTGLPAPGQAIEGLEDALPLRCRNTRSMVGDFQNRAPGLHGDGDLDR